jgi:hypothetical protein
MRGDRRGRATWAPVEKMRGSAQRFDPEACRCRGVEEQSTNTVVKRARDALGSAVLLAGVGAGEAHDRVMGGEEGAHGSVVKLLPIVSLK